MARKIIPVVMAMLLLAAHFLREGKGALALVCLFIPFLLLINKRWALALVQVVMFLGAMVWLQTTIALVQQRWAMDEPWLRMLVILAGVTGFTLFATYRLGSDSVRRYYR